MKQTNMHTAWMLERRTLAIERTKKKRAIKSREKSGIRTENVRIAFKRDRASPEILCRDGIDESQLVTHFRARAGIKSCSPKHDRLQRHCLCLSKGIDPKAHDDHDSNIDSTGGRFDGL